MRTQMLGLMIAFATVYVPPTVAETTGKPPVTALSTAADLILTNGRIKTPTGWAEALAIHAGVIVAVGEASKIGTLRTDKTQVLDLGGDTVLPGLHDRHVHPLFAGLSERQCKIPQGSTLKDIQAKVKACVERAAPGGWIVGGQWDASAIGQAPNRALLDAVAPDNPVLLTDTSAHSSWANSKALAAAGITKDTPNPKGGIIERDTSGEPTGVLREAARTLAAKPVPAPTDEEVRQALQWAVSTMLSFGITSFSEAALGFAVGGEKAIKAYAALADAGVLKQRVRLCLMWRPDDAEAETVIAGRNLHARDRVRPDCIKIMLDGVPTDSHTAAMLEPYAGTMEGRTDEAARKGMLMVKQSVLDQAVTRFDRMGLTVKMHAAGDASVRAGLDAIAAARKANGFSGQLHDVGHCTFVAKTDVQRARALGATFEVSPYLWAPSPINDDITAAIGDARMERVWPVRELIASGALVIPGSDWSVVPSVNPWIGLETLVTREEPGGSKKSFGKAEAITLEQAFALFTDNAAKQGRMADKVGRIEPGMLADVIVVAQNPFAVPISQVHTTKVKMTFINGEKVFDAVAAQK
jgi:predicted amidohydrolase YtcJ